MLSEATRQAWCSLFPAEHFTHLDRCQDVSQIPVLPRHEVVQNMPAILEFAGGHNLTLTHLVRLAFLVGEARLTWPLFCVHFGELLQPARPFTLEDLADVLRSLGADERALGRAYLHQWLPLAVSAGEAQTYFYNRPDLIEEALGLRTSPDRWLKTERAQIALRLLRQMPSVPPSLAESLWAMLLSGARSYRKELEQILGRQAGCQERLLAELGSAKGEARKVAADWLGRRHDPAAVPALQTALGKEKQEAVRSALIGALKTLGAPLEAYLDLPALHRAAAKLNRASLTWFPWRDLPPLHWQDGRPVEESIRDWFVLSAWKGKSPEPSGQLSLYGSLLKDPQALGLFVLRAWIAQDTRPRFTPDEARRRAIPMAQAEASYTGRPVESLIANHTRTLMLECEGSAIADKGLLAVAGAFCDGEAVPLIETYLKTYYGWRAAHCRALLAALAWIEDPRAAAMLLTVSRRFRTKGIQEEADRQVEALAQRKGWTREDLADRTASDAGLDEDGRLRLDLGMRSLEATLDNDLQPILVGHKTFPEPRKDEDEALFAAAKKRWATFKKEATTLVKQQRERLYEAMCAERQWGAQDWRACFPDHPLLRRLAQGCVWLQGGKTFRLLDDGTLSDVAHGTLELSEQPIQLAHSLLVPEPERVAWTEHFADYQLLPLFAQWAPPWELPEDRRMDQALAEGEGHPMRAFALKNAVTRLGYARSPNVDGAWFVSYYRNFPTSGLQVEIEFSGNDLPEQDRDVTLGVLQFRHQGQILTLGEVPRILLSECRGQLLSLIESGLKRKK